MQIAHITADHSPTLQAAQQISWHIEGEEFEVGGQLHHGAAGTESFEVRTPEGHVFRVCVVPVPAALSVEFKPES